MNIPPIEQIRERGAMTPDFRGKEKSFSPQHQDIFQNKLPGGALLDILEKGAEMPDVKAPSMWSKILSWWSNPDLKDSTHLPVNPNALSKIGPINSIPVLETPELISSDLSIHRLPPITKSRAAFKKFTQAEVMEGLSLMSPHTLEEVMFIVLKGQIELEKENAHIAEGTFSKYQELKKLREKVLEEIKEALEKDQKVLGYFKTGQNLAFAATWICGVASLLVTAGVAAPLAGSLPIAFGIISSLSSYGPVVTAALAALTTAGTAYSERRLNEDHAQHEQFRHEDKSLSEQIDHARERLMSIADADNVFKERLIKLLKRLNKMNQLLLQK